MKIEKICIVGGGTAGWIAAASIQKHHPKLDVTLIESGDIPTIGVGNRQHSSSVTGHTTLLCRMSGWMSVRQPTSIVFALKTSAVWTFHSPFLMVVHLLMRKWYLRLVLVTEHQWESTVSFAEWMTPCWKVIKENKVVCEDFPGFKGVNNTGYHLDAVKFANYLKREFCIPRV